jgi:hypothetical protein
MASSSKSGIFLLQLLLYYTAVVFCQVRCDNVVLLSGTLLLLNTSWLSLVRHCTSAPLNIRRRLSDRHASHHSYRDIV